MLHLPLPYHSWVSASGASHLRRNSVFGEWRVGLGRCEGITGLPYKKTPVLATLRDEL